MHANKREEIQKVGPGEIVALTGLKDTTTGQTLCSENSTIIFDLMEFPETVISLAIEAKTSTDEKKLHSKKDPSGISSHRLYSLVFRILDVFRMFYIF